MEQKNFGFQCQHRALRASELQGALLTQAGMAPTSTWAGTLSLLSQGYIPGYFYNLCFDRVLLEKLSDEDANKRRWELPRGIFDVEILHR